MQHATRTKTLSLLSSVLMATACGGADEGTTGDSSGAPTAQKHQFVVWFQPTDPLNVEHYKWHTGRTDPVTGGTQLPCGSAGVRKGVGTGSAAQCNNFQISGKEFLRFHRDFMHRLFLKHVQAGRPASERAPWTSLQSDPNVFAATPTSVRNSYNQLYLNVDPSTNQPFANEDAFGLYLEQFVHNDLHGIVQSVYPNDVNTAGQPVPGTIGPLNLSPTSTYFFKIHGLVETLFMRWQRSKLKDGQYSNLIFRNIQTGTNSVGTVAYNATTGIVSLVSSDTLQSVAIPNTCNWYIGAVADFDFDGNNDIVWHGPGCSGNNTMIWKMNGTTRVSDLPNGTISNVDNTWTLVGAQDFNSDLHPDLLWANKNQDRMVVWYLNGTTFAGFTTSYTLPAGFRAQLVADAVNGAPPNVLARNPNTGETRILVIDGAGNLTTSIPVASPPGGPFTGAVAAGHFHTTGFGVPLERMDIAWLQLSNGSTSIFTTDFSPAVYTDHGAVTGTPALPSLPAGAR